jgi:hypothetical protein
MEVRSPKSEARVKSDAESEPAAFAPLPRKRPVPYFGLRTSAFPQLSGFGLRPALHFAPGRPRNLFSPVQASSASPTGVPKIDVGIAAIVPSKKLSPAARMNESFCTSF